MSKENDCRRICPGTNTQTTETRPQMSPEHFDRTFQYSRSTPSPGVLTPLSSRRPVPPRRPEPFDRSPNLTSHTGRYANQTINVSRGFQSAAGTSFSRSPAGLTMSPDSLESTNTYGRLNARTYGSPGASLRQGAAGPSFSRSPAGLAMSPDSLESTNTYGRLNARTYGSPGAPLRQGAAGTSFLRSPAGLTMSPDSLESTNTHGRLNARTYGSPGASLRYSGSPGGTFCYPTSRHAGGAYGPTRSPGAPARTTFNVPMSPARALGGNLMTSRGARGMYNVTRSPAARTRSYAADEEFSQDSLDVPTDAEEFEDVCDGGAFRIINPRIVYSPYRPPPPREPWELTVLSDDVSAIGAEARGVMSPRMISSTPKNAPPDMTQEFDSGACLKDGIAYKIHAMWNPDDTFGRWATIKTWDLEKEIQWKNLLQRLCYDNNCQLMKGSCHVGLEGMLQSSINALYDPGGFNVGVKMIYDLLKRNKDLNLIPYFEGMEDDKIGEVILGLNKEYNADPNPEPEECKNLSDAEMEMISATNKLLTPEGSEPIQLRPKYFNMLLQWYIRRQDSEEEPTGGVSPYDSLM